jgi:hypothetical protein
MVDRIGPARPGGPHIKAVIFGLRELEIKHAPGPPSDVDERWIN